MRGWAVLEAHLDDRARGWDFDAGVRDIRPFEQSAHVVAKIADDGEGWDGGGKACERRFEIPKLDGAKRAFRVDRGEDLVRRSTAHAEHRELCLHCEGHNFE